MKRVLLLFLCLVILLTGCTGITETNPLQRMKKQLNEEFSFYVSYEYMHLAHNGIAQQMEQIYGKDGSFYFVIARHQWDHTSDYEYMENIEYYYRYENTEMVCYMKEKDGEVSRSVLTEDVIKQMAEDKLKIVGPDTLFPAYLENFTEEMSGEKYSFNLPVDQILEGESFLSVYLQNVFVLSGNAYDSATEINILCTVETEKDTDRPVKISYDFTELKPYVLSEGALSGEFALDMEPMHMVFEFDYDLPETVEIPSGFSIGTL